MIHHGARSCGDAASSCSIGAPGGSVVSMRNQNGVAVKLVATTKGVKFTLGGAGVSMSVKKD